MQAVHEQSDRERCGPAYQPPVGWLGSAWRLLLALLVSALVFGDALEEERAIGEWYPVMDLALGAATLVVIWWRRRWPMTVAVATALPAAFSGWAAGPALWAAMSVSTRRQWREIAPVAAVNIAVGFQFSALLTPDPWWVNLSLNLAVMAAAVGWGMFVGSRRELVWTLRRRAEAAEAEQALRVAKARDDERRRIAREMHDVLAHRISQVAMQAGALSYRDDLDAAALRAGLGDIREGAHEALTDLRQVLGVLREGPGEHRPQPTHADLPALVSEARAAGMTIDVDDRVAPGLPVPLGRTVYRVVQEALTNARKHAPGSRVTVTLAGTPGEGLRLEVRNPLGFESPGTPGAGLGLVGLAERAALAGGTLEHGVADGAFVLRVRLPWSP